MAYSLARRLVWSKRSSRHGLAYMGGGKAISRTLRESSATLEMVGIGAETTKYGHGTRFRLSQIGPQAVTDPDQDALMSEVTTYDDEDDDDYVIDL